MACEEPDWCKLSQRPQWKDRWSFSSVSLSTWNWHDQSKAGASALEEWRLRILGTWLFPLSCGYQFLSSLSHALFANIVWLCSLWPWVFFSLKIVYMMLYFLTNLLGISHQLVSDFMVPAIAFVFISHCLYFSFLALPLNTFHLGPLFLPVQDNGRHKYLLYVRWQPLEHLHRRMTVNMVHFCWTGHSVNWGLILMKSRSC